MAVDESAEGWYRDPYRAHDDRWFSLGRPTALVRDGRVESNDPPPDRPYNRPLVPAIAPASPGDGSDLRRADEAERGDPSAYRDAAMDQFPQMGPLS